MTQHSYDQTARIGLRAYLYAVLILGFLYLFVGWWL